MGKRTADSELGALLERWYIAVTGSALLTKVGASFNGLTLMLMTLAVPSLAWLVGSPGGKLLALVLLDVVAALLSSTGTMVEGIRCSFSLPLRVGEIASVQIGFADGVSSRNGVAVQPQGAMQGRHRIVNSARCLLHSQRSCRWRRCHCRPS